MASQRREQGAHGAAISFCCMLAGNKGGGEEINEEREGSGVYIKVKE